jgi:hypothetical protein
MSDAEDAIHMDAGGGCGLVYFERVNWAVHQQLLYERDRFPLGPCASHW